VYVFVVLMLLATVPCLHKQILDMNPDDEPEEDGANVDLDAHRKKCAVVKTSTRQVCCASLFPMTSLEKHTVCPSISGQCGVRLLLYRVYLILDCVTDCLFANDWTC
jgi:hypothetical protein